MRISGLQKLTLLDFPGVVACIIFTKGCNFRCPFCHNASLVQGENTDEITEEELFHFLEERKNILDGVVITGGEPLIHSDIVEFIKKIKALGYAVKLDTNGTNPQKMQALIDLQLVDYIAMDIKNSKEEYNKACGVDGFLDAITKSVNILLNGSVDYEFRTTVVDGIHTKESIVALARQIKGAKRYFLQQYKNSGDVLNPVGLSSPTEEEMQALLAEISPIIPSSNIR